MLHVARSFVASHASAEEAVQETWLAVIQGIDRFQGRSSVRTWVFHVLVNIARRQGVRENRVVASDLVAADETGPTVDPSRFLSAGNRWAGGWRAGAAPQPWGPEEVALNTEARAVLTAALAQLPNRQRVVIELRDIGGLSGDEVCGILNLSPANQRVLLHRARAKLREHLENYHNHREQP
jgi:RNA polymerase sigma-70 factor (ECF subfamily)